MLVIVANTGDLEVYTPEQRRRRNASVWTPVQGVLAPLQLAAFAVSLWLVINYLATGSGFFSASLSVLIKTALLYSIMITGSLWERDVFGRWLFAPAFYWEDVVSMVVIALHTLYVVMFFFQLGSPEQQMLVALAAYTTYLLNALQFLRKFRMARYQNKRDERLSTGGDNRRTA